MKLVSVPTKEANYFYVDPASVILVNPLPDGSSVVIVGPTGYAIPSPLSPCEILDLLYPGTKNAWERAGQKFRAELLSSSGSKEKK